LVPLLSVKVDVAAATERLSRLERGLRTIARGGERKDVVPPVVEKTLALADEVYNLDASPDGTPWVPVKKPDGQALEETGAMRASLYAERGPYRPDGFFVVVGYGDEKARHHHYGTKHGGPISDDARKPFHPKRLRLGKFENVRRSSFLDPSTGAFGQDERQHIPARPLLPIGDIQAPRWASELESTWLVSFEAWMQKELSL
jgi:phage gpG-like protein